jgi:membrane protein implicated in regulation of membrane protease activity
LIWIALVLFVIWVLGVIVNIGVGVHIVLFVAIGFFIVWAMHRAGEHRYEEVEHTVVTTQPAVGEHGTHRERELRR